MTIGYTVVASDIQPCFYPSDVEAVLMKLVVRDPLLFKLAIYRDDAVLRRNSISKIT